MDFGAILRVKPKFAIHCQGIRLNPDFLIAPSMHVNGSAVKLVATGSWRKWFLLSFQGGQDLSCYDKAVLV